MNHLYSLSKSRGERNTFNSFYEGQYFTDMETKDNTRKKEKEKKKGENSRLVHLINIKVKVINKILANQIQQLKRDHSQVGSIPGM